MRYGQFHRSKASSRVEKGDNDTRNTGIRDVGGLTLVAYVRAYLPPFGVLRTDRFNDVTRRPPNFLFVCFAFFTPSFYLVLSRAVRFIGLEPSVLPTRRTNLRQRIEKVDVRRFAEFSIRRRSTRECAGCRVRVRGYLPTGCIVHEGSSEKEDRRKFIGLEGG